LNSEGFKVVAPIQIASIHVSADARADDGMTVRESFTLVEKQPAGPASHARHPRSHAGDGGATERTRGRPIGEEYTGPVLLEGQASAEIVAQTLVQASRRGVRPKPRAAAAGVGVARRWSGHAVSVAHRPARVDRCLSR
jgi:hypothetical protein